MEEWKAELRDGVKVATNIPVQKQEKEADSSEVLTEMLNAIIYRHEIEVNDCDDKIQPQIIKDLIPYTKGKKIAANKPGISDYMSELKTESENETSTTD